MPLLQAGFLSDLIELAIPTCWALPTISRWKLSLGRSTSFSVTGITLCHQGLLKCCLNYFIPSGGSLPKILLQFHTFRALPLIHNIPCEVFWSLGLIAPYISGFFPG